MLYRLGWTLVILLTFVCAAVWGAVGGLLVERWRG
jgi:hypothetical protein